jgi:hypothetical protein
MSGVLRGFPPSTYRRMPRAKTLVRSCSSKKYLIYELETAECSNVFIDGNLLSYELEGNSEIKYKPGNGYRSNPWS